MNNYILDKQYRELKARMPKHKEAIDYLNELGINYKMIDVAYCNKQTNDNLFPENSLVFPRYNRCKEVISFYARNIKNDNELLLNNSGIFPSYPSSNCKHLLVTETIIDAASLIQHKKIIYDVVTLNKYGDIPDDFYKAIEKSPQLQEVTFIVGKPQFNQNFIHEFMAKMEDVKPHLKFSLVELPDGESLHRKIKHKPLMYLHQLIENRKLLSFNNDIYFKPDSSCIRGRYKNIELLVLGKVNGNELDRMAVNLKIFIGNHSIYKRLNLFHYKDVEAFSKQVAKQTNTEIDDIIQAINQFTNKLEEHLMNEGYVI